jgi:hypothetical protein
VRSGGEGGGGSISAHLLLVVPRDLFHLSLDIRIILKVLGEGLDEGVLSVVVAYVYGTATPLVLDGEAGVAGMEKQLGGLGSTLGVRGGGGGSGRGRPRDGQKVSKRGLFRCLTLSPRPAAK